MAGGDFVWRQSDVTERRNGPSLHAELKAPSEEFVQRLRKILPPWAVDRCLETFSRPKAVGFRINTLKVDREALEGELAEEGIPFRRVPWLAEAYVAPPEARPALVRSAAFEEGRLYIQDLSSILAVEVLGPQPGEEILDLAAAPGGKTCHMAARMKNQGRIAAVDVVRERMYKLKANLKTAGVTIVDTYLMDGRKVGTKTPERFDRVLLDAPCTAEARFSLDDPESFARWSPRKIVECARKQHGLLASAIQAVKPGGTVLYCTCTFSPEENEAIIDDALQRFPGAIEVSPLDLPIENVVSGLTAWEGKSFDPGVVHAVRILPTEEMHGFFLCRLVKLRSLELRSVKTRTRSRKKARKAVAPSDADTNGIDEADEFFPQRKRHA